MKKLKNIFCLSVLAIGAFCVMGIAEVKAGSAQQFQVVCDKESIEPGDNANCFLIAKITDEVSFVETTVTPDTSGIYQTKNLKINGVEGAPTSTTMSAKILPHARGLADIDRIETTHKESGAKNYKCNNTTSYTEESYNGCQLFYALQGEKIKHVADISINGVAALNSGYDGFTVVGLYNVTLSEDATKNDCGRLCIVARYAENDGDAEAALQGATKHCAEIEVKPGEDPGTPTDTGSFTSYLVLIGAAFVAVGAIALAKRNSKFFRV